MGLSFFRNRKTNVVNFVHELDAAWKVRFPGSEILSWKDSGDKKEVGVFIVGRLGKADLGVPALTTTTLSIVLNSSLSRRPCRR
jgi:hypothetical protein